MKKKYPPRNIHDDDKPIWYDDECECGDSWADHPLDWKFQRGKCEKCTCPKYILDKDNPSKRRLEFSKQQPKPEVEQ